MNGMVKLSLSDYDILKEQVQKYTEFFKNYADNKICVIRVATYKEDYIYYNESEAVEHLLKVNSDIAQENTNLRRKINESNIQFRNMSILQFIIWKRKQGGYVND